MVGFGTTKLTRVWEPALLWNQLRFKPRLGPESVTEMFQQHGLPRFALISSSRGRVPSLR
jgi:hypothetical protein